MDVWQASTSHDGTERADVGHADRDHAECAGAGQADRDDAGQGGVEQSVRAAVRRLMAAADHLDVEGFVAMFHPDADFHNPIGMVMRGRDEIRSLHEKLYSPEPSPGFPTFANSTSTGEILSVRVLAADVAIVDWAWTQQGGMVDGRQWRARSGNNTLVWVRDGDGEWRVIAWRDKDFPPDFEPPPGYQPESAATDNGQA